ncbi:MAG: HEAT repeat domain-containing protein [Elusimicrobia bacterium]|nr:HEAT repeat domain-containing protein [Elusimicrobiota bacterium]
MARVFLILVILGGGIYFYVKHLGKKEEAPPPPPPVIEIPEPLFLHEAEVAQILRTTKDSDPHVRWAAIELLYRMGHPEAMKLIENTIAMETNAEIRHQAINFLKSAPHKDASRQILPALGDTDIQTRSAALTALGERGDKEIAPEIVKMLSDSEPDVRVKALQALSRLQSKRAEEYRALQDELRRNYQEALELAKQRAKGKTTTGGPSNVWDVGSK